MAFTFETVETAQSAPGLRMVVIKGVPSPWSESAKGLFHLRKLDWRAVYHDPSNPALRAWTGTDNAPVALYNDERARTGWAEILFLSERLGAGPSLLPSDAEDRASMFGLSHELLGEEGLCWLRRLQLIGLGLKLEGEPRKHSEYLAKKYGYREQNVEALSEQIAGILELLAKRLRKRQSSVSGYYFAERPLAIDVFSAASMALLSPLPQELCDMPDSRRLAFSNLTRTVAAALDPILLEHRDHMYREHLETPLRF